MSILYTKRNFFSILLAIFVFANAFCIPTFAANIPEGEEQVVYYEDGSYDIVTITYDYPSGTPERGTVKKTSGIKEYVHYNSADQPLWTFRVHGSFEYNGSSAEATDADYSQSVHVSAWSFTSASAYCSGASAIADGSFKKGIIPISTTITLTCSKDGKLS